MKNIFRMAAAILAATLVAGGGKALAAGWKTGSDPRSQAMSMSDESSKAPLYGTFEYEEALETGKLPAGAERAIDPPATGGSVDEGSVIEVGGLKYRVGIDTP